ncbi:zinc dependent phospholipase C family protein [Kitasatospora sp. NPDC085879]|uniref:zinc dependent phospholipase C family protein n=1 Tax=Kitasatospora sp. NPDC085879 TaxID=3154769 RepID=UPI00342539DC
MPGLYAHMDIARKALSNLSANPGAAALFASGGPSAATLENIAKKNPAYTALGAIGPDMFFLLPDFKKGMAEGLWGASQTIKDLYTWWDENFLEPWEETLGPVAMNNADTLGALTGGVLTQLGDLASNALSFLITFVEDFAVRQFDAFGLLGSGVPSGYDEQTFFWSDMFHYRKTFEFGHHLFKKAKEAGNEAHMAFALGWMSHLATDVTGHAFTNEKCGGPYRLHWQRHHLVENHMDARLCDSEHGDDDIYNMLNNSAQHLWIAFNGDGSSRHDFFAAQPGPSYATGDTTPDILDRASKWDVDSDLPPDLAEFVSGAAREFFTAENLHVDQPTGASAAHPTIIADHDHASAGYADAEAVTTLYWWLYHYLKWTTTDYYKMRRPEFSVVVVPPYPSPPGSGIAAPGPGDDDSSIWQDAFSLLLAILAWILYIGQVISWGVTALTSIVTSFSTAPLRYLVYEYLELPLYNAWSSLHWYLAHTGFVLPTKAETSPGLMTLGLAPQDSWSELERALDNLSGGIDGARGTGPTAATEPSGDPHEELPKEVVVDPPGFLPEAATLQQGLTGSGTPGGQIPSEFLRPWLYPSKNQDGSAVKTEPSASSDARVHLSPYGIGQDATVLLQPTRGDAGARTHFEGARSEAQTLEYQRTHLPRNETLGGPIDFTGYVVAKLTRDDPGAIPNFNLDSDRGYAYLCWDWLRTKDSLAAPGPYQDAANPARSGHQYHPPVAPGHGWNDDDVISGPTPPQHDPKTPQPVRLRYIDREEKFA